MKMKNAYVLASVLVCSTLLLWPQVSLASDEASPSRKEACTNPRFAISSILNEGGAAKIQIVLVVVQAVNREVAITTARNSFVKQYPGYKYNPGLTIAVDVPDGPRTCGGGQHKAPDAPSVPSTGASPTRFLNLTLRGIDL